MSNYVINIIGDRNVEYAYKGVLQGDKHIINIYVGDNDRPLLSEDLENVAKQLSDNLKSDNEKIILVSAVPMTVTEFFLDK